MTWFTRRSMIRLAGASAAAGMLRPYRGIAADKAVTIGIDLSLTGADAETAVRIRDGFMLAIDEANAKGGAAGYHLNVLLLDDGTATAGQYDPAQGATNVRKMVADRSVVAALGPMSSTPGKAMSPIFSQGNLATITPTSTNPDITDPKFAVAVPSGRQGDLLPHRHHGCLSGTQHGELLRRHAEGEERLRPGRQRRLWHRHRHRVRGTGEEARHRGAGSRPARSEGRRLHAGADQDQGARRAVDLLRRRRPGWREAGQAGLRSGAEPDQGGRRRHVRPVDPARRRLPGSRRLVRDRRLSAHDGGGGHAALGEALRRQERAGSRPTIRSPPTTPCWW